MFDPNAMNQANQQDPNDEGEIENGEKVIYADPKDRRKGVMRKGGADKEITTFTIGASRY